MAMAWVGDHDNVLTMDQDLIYLILSLELAMISGNGVNVFSFFLHLIE